MAQEFSEETVEYVKRAIWMESRKLAVIVKAMYEKYGQEAMDVMGEAMRKFGHEKGEQYRKEAGLEPHECDVEQTLTKIYPQAHKHFSPAGLDMERVAFSAQKSESKVHSCSQLNAWKDIWDKPWIMCEIFAT